MESSLEAIEALVLATVPSDAPDRGEAAAGRRAGRNEARRSVARLAGTIPDRATRRVSLRGGDARPIGNVGSAGRSSAAQSPGRRRGGGIISTTRCIGSPVGAAQFAAAVERVIHRASRDPRSVSADRGYRETSVKDALNDLGVGTVVIPGMGKAGNARRAEEHGHAFRGTVTWRTGSEGRISNLRPGYVGNRSRPKNTAGPQIWNGQASSFRKHHAPSGRRGRSLPSEPCPT